MRRGIPKQMPNSVNSSYYNNMPVLSAKATSDTHGEDSPYFHGWKEHDRNPYHPKENPTGVIQMGLAENQLSFDLLEGWVADHPDASICSTKDGIPSSFREVALYQDYHGMLCFRKALAKFMEGQRGTVRFDPNRLIPTAGATAAHDLLMFCLADPGEAFLVPSPYYPGFDRDLRWRTGMELIAVDCYSSNNFEVTKYALERAYDEARSRNITVKGVILTNPSNPLGTMVGAETLKSLLEFVTEKNIHLVCDEIYSGTVFSSPRFVSIAEVLSSTGSWDRYSNRVHIIYSLSKDLGLPGFRVGVIYSYNDTVVTAARRMSSFCLVSSQTQHLLSAILSDSDFVQKYISVNEKRLRERHRVFVEGLNQAGIKCLKSNAGLFCWVDLTNLLPSPDQDGEIRLWKLIVLYVGLNVSPGSSFHCTEPGWFRFCFANMDEDTLKVSLERIQRFTRLYRDYIKPLHGCIDALLKIEN